MAESPLFLVPGQRSSSHCQVRWLNKQDLNHLVVLFSPSIRRNPSHGQLYLRLEWRKSLWHLRQSTTRLTVYLFRLRLSSMLFPVFSVLGPSYTKGESLETGGNGSILKQAPYSKALLSQDVASKCTYRGDSSWIKGPLDVFVDTQSHYSLAICNQE